MYRPPSTRWGKCRGARGARKTTSHQAYDDSSRTTKEPTEILLGPEITRLSEGTFAARKIEPHEINNNGPRPETPSVKKNQKKKNTSSRPRDHTDFPSERALTALTIFFSLSPSDEHNGLRKNFFPQRRTKSDQSLYFVWQASFFLNFFP